ncbi:MAG: XTP/dITP diphosphatase [Ignavibacteria bacterium]|nr:XTP/dITP diphosphatase [Ignavibacteria bacterium]
MKKIFIASKNKGKIEEIRSYLAGFGIEIFSLLDSHELPEVEETGATFEENAHLKAKAIFDIVKIPVLADDSGLETDSLGGSPGIYSARFSGEGATDERNNLKLLKELENVPDDKRTARFVCVLALYDGINSRYFEGTCEGKIAFASAGTNGFGYDPLFIPAGYDQTFGELGSAVKTRISHRAKALRSLKKFLDLEKSLVHDTKGRNK